MGYPYLPNNRMIVNGDDLNIKYGMVLVDGYSITPPEPKIYKVDIPGGNGSIDLTEALSGDVTYNETEGSFSFVVIHPYDFTVLRSKIINFIHGKEFDFKLTSDPEYTYHGRATIKSISDASDYAVIEIKMELEPYKLKEVKTYVVNGYAGKMFTFPSGRMPVRPIMECSNPVEVAFDGVTYTVPAGSHRMNNVVFREGDNQLYINSFKIVSTKWSDISTDRWNDYSTMRWDELQALMEVNESDLIRSWDDLSTKRWSDMSGSTWNSLNSTQVVVPGSDIVYIQYEWKDLVG